MRTVALSRWIVAAWLALGTAACGAGERTGARAVVRDSAGITIVENTTPLWRDGDAWSLTAEPTVQIGVMEGEAEYQLHRTFRIADGDRMEGHVVEIGEMFTDFRHRIGVRLDHRATGTPDDVLVDVGAERAVDADLRGVLRREPARGQAIVE